MPRLRDRFKKLRTKQRTTGRRQTTARRGLRAELLEDRRLLAGDLNLVADIRLGSENSNVSNLTALDGNLYFTANDEGGEAIWRHSQSGSTTEKLIDPGSGQPLSGFDLQEFQGQLVLQVAVTRDCTATILPPSQSANCPLSIRPRLPWLVTQSFSLAMMAMLAKSYGATMPVEPYRWSAISMADLIQAILKG